MRIKKFTCESCGGNEYHVKGKKIICDYCHSEYEINSESKKIVAKTFSWSLKLILGIVATLVGLVVILGLIFVFSFTKNMKQSSSLDNTQYGLSHISEVSGHWTKDDYLNLQVAESTYDPNKDVTTYSGGVTFDEIVKKFGKPQELTHYKPEKGETNPGHFAAVWKNIGDKDYIAIELDFDEKSQQLYFKDIYGDK